jgi:hypothetical protein
MLGHVGREEGQVGASVVTRGVLSADAAAQLCPIVLSAQFIPLFSFLSSCSWNFRSRLVVIRAPMTLILSLFITAIVMAMIESLSDFDIPTVTNRCSSTEWSGSQ